jgi:hypothetical protein
MYKSGFSALQDMDYFVTSGKSLEGTLKTPEGRMNPCVVWMSFGADPIRLITQSNNSLVKALDETLNHTD